LKEVNFNSNLSLNFCTKLSRAYKTLLPNFTCNKHEMTRLSVYYPSILDLKIQVEIFCFKLISINKSHRV
jgi:hypothetical protein